MKADIHPKYVETSDRVRVWRDVSDTFDGPESPRCYLCQVPSVFHWSAKAR